MIRLIDTDGAGNATSYLVYPDGSLSAGEVSSDSPALVSGAVSSVYLSCGIENTTTTTTSSSTTTTTTTLSPTCNEYEVSGPTALYYTDCFGQQAIVSVASGQTENVCASVAIPGATLIGPCPDYTTHPPNLSLIHI